MVHRAKSTQFSVGASDLGMRPRKLILLFVGPAAGDMCLVR